MKVIHNSTISFVIISQKRRDDNGPGLPHTHAQKALLHAVDETAPSHIRVVCGVLKIAVIEFTGKIKESE